MEAELKYLDEEEKEIAEDLEFQKQLDAELAEIDREAEAQAAEPPEVEPQPVEQPEST